jgi:hypothetical protein
MLLCFAAYLMLMRPDRATYVSNVLIYASNARGSAALLRRVVNAGELFHQTNIHTATGEAQPHCERTVARTVGEDRFHLFTGELVTGGAGADLAAHAGSLG